VRPAGYLLNKEEGLSGEPGLYYDYIVAGNGLFLRAQNSLIKATVLISPAEIRGLPPLKEEISLVHGKIPGRLYDLSLSILAEDREMEKYLAVTWESEYRLSAPDQKRSELSVKYNTLPSLIMDIHSHGRGIAFFSMIDDADEQGLRLYMVVGKLNTLLPEVELRLGAYGYFASMRPAEVFDV